MKGPDGYSEADWLALSGIQHFSFCKRQWALIHIEQLWSENYLTTAGIWNMNAPTIMRLLNLAAIC